MKKAAVLVCLVLLIVSVGFAASTSSPQASKDAKQEVVVYTSLDKEFSQPVLDKFEKQTGIKVLLAVYDSEATKTIGLVNRLIAEKNNPKADIFWNSETGKTIALKQKGVLEKYVSPSASVRKGRLPAMSLSNGLSMRISSDR